MLKALLIISLFTLSFQLNAESAFNLSFGPVKTGDSRINLSLRDFDVKPISLKGVEIKSSFIRNSTQWVRTAQNLLVPRARLAIMIMDQTPNIHIVYKGQAIIPENRGKHLYTEIFVDLFGLEDAKVMSGNKELSHIEVTAKKPKKGKKTKLIDYSCSRSGIQITGLDDQYMSVGCRMERRGTWHKGRPRLVVTWSTTNYRLKDGTEAPFVSYFNQTGKTEVTLVDRYGKEVQVSLSAKLPKRLHRMKTAVGFGPYFLESSFEGQSNDKWGPAFMIYGKYDFTPTVSARFFDALVYNESIFNNSGLYFAYHLADLMDGKVSIVPLLGFQGLYFKFKDNPNTNNNIIYPQGFEVVWRHAFDIENYTIVYGMFLSTDDNERYTNAWIRWGKGYFWELNFIEWGLGSYKATTWGLSVGLPFLQFF